MILLIFAVSFVACMGFLGKKLIAKKAPDVAADQENMFEELKDLQSLKINNITAQEFNNYTVGIALLFMAYLAALYIVLGIINQIYIACNLVDGVESYGGGGMAFIYLLNCIVIMVQAVDQVYFYAFFKKAVAPNLKHGALIIERINKFVKKLLTIQAIIMLIATLYIDPQGEQYVGTASIVSSIIIMVMWTLTVRVELFRVGLPNFFDGMKKMMGGSGCGLGVGAFGIGENLFGNFSFGSGHHDSDSGSRINPATGAPMAGGVDVTGSPYGINNRRHRHRIS